MTTGKKLKTNFRGKTKRSEKLLNNHMASWLTGLGEKVPTFFSLVSIYFDFILFFGLDDVFNSSSVRQRLNGSP